MCWRIVFKGPLSPPKFLLKTLKIVRGYLKMVMFQFSWKYDKHLIKKLATKDRIPPPPPTRSFARPLAEFHFALFLVRWRQRFKKRTKNYESRWPRSRFKWNIWVHEGETCENSLVVIRLFLIFVASDIDRFL